MDRAAKMYLLFHPGMRELGDLLCREPDRNAHAIGNVMSRIRIFQPIPHRHGLFSVDVRRNIIAPVSRTSHCPDRSRLTQGDRNRRSSGNFIARVQKSDETQSRGIKRGGIYCIGKMP